MSHSQPGEPLEIFTDGCSFQHPRVGGIGVRLLAVGSSGEQQVQDIHSSGFKGATNNQMELEACITGLTEATKLAAFPDASYVIVYTDSLYIVENYKKAMFDWPRTRWRLSNGRPVLNADLWKALVKAVRKAGKRVDFRWVRGHSKNQHNRAAHRLARASAGIAFNTPLSVVHVRRKQSSYSVELGSVKMEGQRLTMRVITTEYLKVQGLWKCKYEVVSRTSPYKGNVDIIFSDALLSAGHTYYVRVSDNTVNPRVQRVFREIRPKPDASSTKPGNGAT